MLGRGFGSQRILGLGQRPGRNPPVSDQHRTEILVGRPGLGENDHAAIEVDPPVRTLVIQAEHT